ncbi:hypothetical protein PV326_012017 [Microctonus aethiopoides]|nr:hypothetical protein PV326_012017 [Microctonus aethiopoides]
MKLYGKFLFIAIALALFSMPSVTANTGHFYGGFRSVGCSHDGDCDFLQACRQGICIRACETLKCGLNTYCSFDGNHGAACKCILTHKGDPYAGCVKKSDYELSKTPEYSNYGFYPRNNN